MFGVTRQCHGSIAVLRQTVAAEVSISATLQATATCVWQHEGMMQICFRKGSCGVEPEWPLTPLSTRSLSSCDDRTLHPRPHHHQDPVFYFFFAQKSWWVTEMFFVHLFFCFLKCSLASFAPLLGGGLAGRITTDSRWWFLPVVGRCVRVYLEAALNTEILSFTLKGSLGNESATRTQPKALLMINLTPRFWPRPLLSGERSSRAKMDRKRLVFLVCLASGERQNGRPLVAFCETKKMIYLFS